MLEGQAGKVPARTPEHQIVKGRPWRRLRCDEIWGCTYRAHRLSLSRQINPPVKADVDAEYGGCLRIHHVVLHTGQD